MSRAPLLGFALLLVALVDAFLTVVVARRAQRVFHLIANYFYRVTWAPLAAVARRVQSGPAPRGSAQLLRPALTAAAARRLGHNPDSRFRPAAMGRVGLRWVGRTEMDFVGDLYVSATTFFTLGLFDPANTIGKKCSSSSRWRWATASLVSSSVTHRWLYSLYNARETRISLLDARAGSPPSAAEVHRAAWTRRGIVAGGARGMGRVGKRRCSRPSSAYPMLGYFRSQHTNESWLGALVTIVDASALVMLTADGDLQRQARLTFAMGRHALVDLAAVFHTAPRAPLSRPAGAGPRGRPTPRPGQPSDVSRRRPVGLGEAEGDSCELYEAG